MAGWQHRLDGHEFLVNPEELPSLGHPQLAAAPLVLPALEHRAPWPRSSLGGRA